MSRLLKTAMRMPWSPKKEVKEVSEDIAKQIASAKKGKTNWGTEEPENYSMAFPKGKVRPKKKPEPEPEPVHDMKWSTEKPEDYSMAFPKAKLGKKRSMAQRAKDYYNRSDSNKAKVIGGGLGVAGLGGAGAYAYNKRGRKDEE